MILIYILIFLVSCLLLYFSSEWMIESLMRIAKFLGWKEFVIAFFVMAFAASAPNFFVGISSAIHKIPQLSFGEVIGGNIVDLTLAFALAILISKNTLPAPSRVVQNTGIFTITVSILPLLLAIDGILSRGDGLVLLITFLAYMSWLFSKEERFKMVYEENKSEIIGEFKHFSKDLLRIILSLVLLILASEGLVKSVKYFFEFFKLSIPVIGILIVGLANTLPEIYFAIRAAKEGKTWMVLGNLMGAVIVPSTLVLGIVALICPIIIPNLSPFIVTLAFLIIAISSFFVFIRTDKAITKKEAIFLLSIYIFFVLFQILFAR
ncbi:MAG: hypothetical protein ABH876_00515 [Patescibacteria group bacterium]